MDAENTHHQNTGDESGGISRKTLLKAALIAPIPLLVGRAPALARDAQRTDGLLDPTPFCDDGDDPTTAQTEGPYFRPNSPRRTSLVGPGTPGVPLTVRGYVFGRSCRPIANALLDFWQADTNGAYDNSGFGFRGHRFSDAQGAFKLTTIVPGLYPGRTRHIHVKVQAPNRPVLTTQRGGTWKAGTNYKAGDQVTYGGVTYRCLQGHTAYAGWEPPNVPALWQRV